MKTTVFKPSNAIVLEVTPKEFDIISHAVLLLSWSAIGIERDEEKLQIIEDIKDSLNNVLEAYPKLKRVVNQLPDESEEGWTENFKRI